MNKNNLPVQIIVYILLLCIAIFLYKLKLPFDFLPAILHVDLSILAEMMSMYLFGPIFGIVAVAIKNVFSIIFFSSYYVSELSNFATTTVLILVCTFFANFEPLKAKLVRTWKVLLVSSAIGIIVSAGFLALFTQFVSFPLFEKSHVIRVSDILSYYNQKASFISETWQGILVFNVPVYIIKCFVSAVIVSFAYKPFKIYILDRKY